MHKCGICKKSGKGGLICRTCGLEFCHECGKIKKELCKNCG